MANRPRRTLRASPATRRAGGWSLAATLLLATIATSPTIRADGTPPDPQRAQALLKKAIHLWQGKQDYNGALRAYNEAVETDPDSLQIRLERAGFLEIVSGMVIEKDRDRFKRLAREDYEFITRRAPDSVAAGVARDGIARIEQRVLFPETSVSCPPGAKRAYDEAEERYHRRDMKAAVKRYATAADACPESAAILVSYADSYYLLKQYDRADRLFRKAIEIDPWDRKAHRFLADTENRLGHNEEALRQAALAIISDPTYEAAWASLRQLAGIQGRGWARIYGDKPRVTAGTDDAGKRKVAIALRDGPSPSATAGSDRPGGPGDDASVWTGYALFKAGVLDGFIIEPGADGIPVKRFVDPTAMTALEIERLAVRGGLTMLEEMSASSGNPPGPFWSMMARADRAGFLDEAILIHLVDEGLVGDYLAYRDRHADRLLSYLETLMVPAPDGETHPPSSR
jgi:tetratricopeptide (TPR) repeat protein